MQRVAVTTQGANADAMIAKNALEISKGRSVFKHGELAMRIADIVSGGKFDPPGVIDSIFFARAACGSLANRVETCCKVSICRWTLASIWSLQWPTLTVTMPPRKSRYWLPSASQTYWSLPRAITRGSW